ncbi:hypothetical protein [Lelliottia nimipressuralis]|uniref:Uncharacterized protein n=1 Tax=Lelliottia nimipressuralis TaxID=69220 RepID=A0ABD4KHW0_9ENTR|nr:hypothetical protein [Lelliottia nimipressuralis]MBF4180402.1 hypothetical protein [Lelliottia nimipressuralis]
MSRPELYNKVDDASGALAMQYALMEKQHKNALREIFLMYESLIEVQGELRDAREHLAKLEEELALLRADGNI